MSEKEYIISLIDKYINYLEEKDNNKNISYFKDVLVKIGDNSSYIYDFIIGINENLIVKLLNDIKYENNGEFLLLFTSLKEKLVGFNGDYTNLKLDDKENNLVSDFKNIIAQYVNSNNSDIDYLLEFKDRLNSNKHLLEKDYDILEDIIYLFKEDNSDVIYEEVMDYLNRYNISLIRKYSKKEKKKTVYTKVGDDKSINVTPFDNMVSFDFVPKERSRVNRKRKIDDNNLKVDIKDIFKGYGFNYELIHDCFKGDINNIDSNKIKTFLEYLGNNTSLNNIDDNGKILGLLVAKSDIDTFKLVSSELKDIYKLDNTILDDLLRRFTVVFTKDGYDNFKNNYNLLVSVGVNDLGNIVKKNIYFLLNDYDNNLDIYNKLNELGINVNGLFKDALNVLCVNNDLLVKNIKVLDSYGFDLRDEEDYKSFSILLINDLGRALDMFIEMGYSEFIHDKPELTLRNIKSLIIKRILFAYKNNLKMWDNITLSSPNKINKNYEELILNKKILSEDEINLLIKEHSILNLLDSGMRITAFNDPYFGSIKRKTEFVFNKKIVSRIKTYSIFKVLIDNNVKEEDALLYALTYNMDLNEYEYNSLKQVVYRNMGD